MTRKWIAAAWLLCILHLAMTVDRVFTPLRAVKLDHPVWLALPSSAPLAMTVGCSASDSRNDAIRVMMAITQRRPDLEDAKRRWIPDIVLAVIVGARHASPDSGGAAVQAIRKRRSTPTAVTWIAAARLNTFSAPRNDDGWRV